MKYIIQALGGLSVLLLTIFIICSGLNMLWFEFNPIWFKLSGTSLIFVVVFYLIDDFTDSKNY